VTVTDTHTYNVPDISCDHCKHAIESAVGPLPHLESVNVDVAAKTVTVTGGDPIATESAIVEAGYAIA
jgi:copper chaperone